MKIFKYMLDVSLNGKPSKLVLPASARFLSIGNQGDGAFIWCEVSRNEDQEETMEHDIYMVGTGHIVPPEANTFLGTVHFGWKVYHYYTNRSGAFLK